MGDSTSQGALVLGVHVGEVVVGKVVVVLVGDG